MSSLIIGNTDLSLKELLNIDRISVEILPEKKGYIKRHVEYDVHSSRFKSQVVRRYSDFHAFYEVLSWRFPNRILPPLPPQKLSAFVKGTDSNFAESRRKGLLRWLVTISAHPVMSPDPALEFFLSRIVDDLATAIRDQFRSLPDEFVTGPLGQNPFQLDCSSQLENVNKVPVESLIKSLDQIIQTLEKTSQFSHGKKEDFVQVSKDLNTVGHTQGKSPVLGFNWAGSKDLMAKITSDLAKIGSAWSELGTEYDLLVLEPFKQLKDVLQGFKELIERNASEKVLNMEFKRNSERVQNMRQNKSAGLVTSPEIRTKIEDRIGEIHVDDYHRRKDFILSTQNEENRLVCMFMGKLFLSPKNSSN